MTRHGMAVQLYGRYEGRRPFSLFARDTAEQRENHEWSKLVDEWAETYMNEAGGLNQAGIDKYVLKVEGREVHA